MSSRRTLIGGIGLVALLAIVAVASRAHTPAGGGTTRGIDGRILLEYLLLVMLALSAVVIPVGIWLFVSGRNDDLAAQLPERKNWMWPLFWFMAGAAIVSVILLRSGWLRSHGRDATNPLERLLGLGNHGAKDAKLAASFDWGPVIVVGSISLVVIAALGVWALQHRRQRTAAKAAIPAAQFAAAVERTIADLRAEPDPRRAVIAAYAQMEQALGLAGLPRDPSEAPREYLGRVLPQVGAGADSVGRLTSLFERAKFSPHEIDETMKEEAISALESLRDDLQAGE
jgi:Domain of unknown function (DUF4129)